MIAVLINFCTKAIAAIIAEIVNEQISAIPWIMSEQIATEVVEALGIQPDKVKDYVKLAQNTSNVIAVGEASFNAGKSEDVGENIRRLPQTTFSSAR